MLEGRRESFLPKQFIWPVGELAARWQESKGRNWSFILYFQVEGSALTISAVSVNLSQGIQAPYLNPTF